MRLPSSDPIDEIEEREEIEEIDEIELRDDLRGLLCICGLKRVVCSARKETATMTSRVADILYLHS